jgi:hypothetical protein
MAAGRHAGDRRGRVWRVGSIPADPSVADGLVERRTGARDAGHRPVAHHDNRARVAWGSTRASPTASAVAGPAGRWTTTVTEDDLRDAGVTDPALIAAHAGSYRLVLVTDGTWTRIHEPSASAGSSVWRGTWTAAPDRIRLITAGPAERRGEVLDATWRVREGRLVLRVDEAPADVIRAAVEAHPWAPAE